MVVRWRLASRGGVLSGASALSSGQKAGAMMGYTKQLSDAERDRFAACGIIVIDGELIHVDAYGARYGDLLAEVLSAVVHDEWIAPEGWRILTEPCDTCGGDDLILDAFKVPDARTVCPNPDCVGGCRVVTLTATCPTCDGTYWTPRPLRGHGSHCSVCRLNFSRCNCTRQRCTLCITTPGVVTLGRFTIPALLPVEVILPRQDRAPGTNQYATRHDRLTVHPLTNECYLWLDGNGHAVTLDPLPHAGQFITRPERVEVPA